MRRLPVYFLIDVSESMAGEPLRQVEDGLAMIIRELKRDPYALETVFLSILCFAGRTKTIVPLTDIISFYPPRLPLGSGTALGTALDHLATELKANLLPTTEQRKGDWKPLIFLFTDGAPTDKFDQAVQRWQAAYGTRATFVSIAFGDHVDTAALYRISENVLLFKNTDPEAYKAFFKWVTASIKATSQSVNTGQAQDLNLAPREPGLIEQVPGAATSAPPGVDSAVATFLGRCQTSKKPYLVKYKLTPPAAYRLEGAYTLGDDYFEFSEEGGGRTQASIHIESLHGFPSCPNCGNSHALCMCPCGGIFCTDDTPTATCPWCNRSLQFSSEGTNNFSINRTKG